MVIYVDVEVRHVGVDLVDFDAVLIFWPSLHISARRALATRGVDSDAVELANAVQLAGQARRAEVIVFADPAFSPLVALTPFVRSI